jgi:hypothetical protein
MAFEAIFIFALPQAQHKAKIKTAQMPIRYKKPTISFH